MVNQNAISAYRLYVFIFLVWWYTAICVKSYTSVYEFVQKLNKQTKKSDIWHMTYDKWLVHVKVL